MTFKRQFTELELEAYLDEALAPPEMLEIETALRHAPALVDQLATINGRRNSGIHTLGEIWRRHRASCISREHLGTYLLGVLSAEQSDYIQFHIEKVGCRYCWANLEDLKRQQKEASDSAIVRRKKYFQSSAGYLRGTGG